MFIRPGMQRVVTDPRDNATGQHDLLISAWKDKNNQLVIVGINHGTKDARIRLALKGDRTNYKKMVTYLTDGNQADNMKASPGKKFSPDILLPARSISTLVLN